MKYEIRQEEPLAKRIIVTSLAFISLSAATLPLVKAATVNAADFMTSEEIEAMENKYNHAQEIYQNNFDTHHEWDGVVQTPDEVAANIAANNHYTQGSNSHFVGPNHATEQQKEPVLVQEQASSANKTIVKQNGVVDVNNESGQYSILYSFSKEGNIKQVRNRALGNNTPWFTDQCRIYGNHYYYRVATNEWVQDSNIVNLALK